MPHKLLSLLIAACAVLFGACGENEVPFPYLTNSPTAFNLTEQYRLQGESEPLLGKVAMFTRQQYSEYAGLLSQHTVGFDSVGHCLDYYFRDKEECRHCHFSYDSLGRRIEELCYCDTAGISFDSLNQLYTKTCYRYSRNGRSCRARITGPDGKRHTFRYRYDKQGRLFRFIYPDGSRISYYYDSDGRLSKTLFPDGSDERYEYREDGSLRQMRDRDGVMQWYLPDVPEQALDSLGRVVEELRGGQQLTAYRYDDHGNWVRRTISSPDLPTILTVREIAYY